MGQSLQDLDKWTIQWLRERELGHKFTIRNQPARDTLWKTLYNRFDVQSMWLPKDTVDDTHHGAVFNFDFSTDGSVLAAACEQKSLLLFDPLNGKLIHTRNGAHTDCVNCVKFLDSRLFASCSDDTSIALWDCRYLKNRVRTLQGHSNWVKNIEYSHDDGKLLTSGFDGSIFLWDINRYSEQNEGKCVFHMNGLMRSKLTPDGSKLVISTTGGYLIVIHDLNLDTLAHDLQGFRPNMYRLMQMSGQPIRQGYQFNHLFERTRNRVEFISDFPTGNDAEVIASLQVHPQGWCVLSRNTSGDENTEFTSVHDIQTIPKDQNNDSARVVEPPSGERSEDQSAPSGSATTRGQGSVVINIRVEETDDPDEAGTVQIHPISGRSNRRNSDTIQTQPLVLDSPESVPSMSHGNLETVDTPDQSNSELIPDEPMESTPIGDLETSRQRAVPDIYDEDLETAGAHSMFGAGETESRSELYQIGDTSRSPRSDIESDENHVESPRSDSGNRQQSPRSDSGNRQQSPRSDSNNIALRQQSLISDDADSFPQTSSRDESENSHDRQPSPSSISETRQESPERDSANREEAASVSNTDEQEPVISYAFINVGVTYGEENSAQPSALILNRQMSASTRRLGASNVHSSDSNSSDSASNVEQSSSNVQQSSSNVQHSASNVQQSSSNVQHSASDVQQRTSSVQDSDSDQSDTEDSARTSTSQHGFSRPSSSQRHASSRRSQGTQAGQTHTFGRGRISLGDLQSGPFRQQLQRITGPNRETVTYVIRSGANVAEQTLLLLNQGRNSRPHVPSGARIHQNTPRLTHYIAEPNVGRGFIKELCFNSDGRLICSPFGFAVRLLAFDPDLRELCDCTLEEPVVLYEVNSHINHASYVVSTKFSPVHSLFVTGSMEGKVAFYQPRL